MLRKKVEAKERVVKNFGQLCSLKFNLKLLFFGVSWCIYYFGSEMHLASKIKTSLIRFLTEKN